MKTLGQLLSSFLLLLALFCLAFLVLGNEGVKANREESSIAVWMYEDESDIAYADAYHNDTLYFNLSLENYDSRDNQGRYIFLNLQGVVEVGYEERWELKVMNPMEGENVVNFTYEGNNYYKFFVEGDGTPTKVELAIDHHYTRVEDNQDRIRFQVWGFDLDEEEDPHSGNWTHFLEEKVDYANGDTGGTCNVTYLLEDQSYVPDFGPGGDEFVYEGVLNTRVIPNPLDPAIYCNDNIVVTPGEPYNLSVNLVNEGNQEDEIRITAELNSSTGAYWELESSNYDFGSRIELGSAKGKLIYLEITASPDFEDIPEGEYDLVLTAISQTAPFCKDIHTIKVTVPKRYEPLLTVVGEDDKNAAVDGSFTTFNLRLRNDGALNESFDMFAQVQDKSARAAGKTDAYWDKMFSLGPVRVEAGNYVAFTVNLSPELDNTKIAPGKYPIRLVATSQNNTARFSETEIIIRMPNLYNPEARLDSAPPSPHRYNTPLNFLFTITNNGVVEDTMTLDFNIEGDDIFTAHNPGDWLFEFRDYDTGQNLSYPYQVTLGTTPETKSRSIHLFITAQTQIPLGSYPLTIIARSEGPIPVQTTDWQGEPLMIVLGPYFPDLSISTEDIRFSENPVTEGDPVTITATVHLDGYIGSNTVTVGFYYRSAQGFTFIGERELNYGGASDTKQNISFTWEKAWVPNSPENNIRVVVDARDVVLEEDENNNDAEATLKVTEKRPPPPNDEITLPLILGAGVVLFLIFLALFFGLGLVNQLPKSWREAFAPVSKKEVSSPQAAPGKLTSGAPPQGPGDLEGLVVTLKKKKETLRNQSSGETLTEDPLIKQKRERLSDELDMMLGRLEGLNNELETAMNSAENILTTTPSQGEDVSKSPKDSKKGETP